MPFAKADGTKIDIYQLATQMPDETTGDRSEDIHAADWIALLLDRALGSQGYYGVVTTNDHTDYEDHEGSQAIVDAALARNVPVISTKQMLDWTDGRNNSSFSNIAWSGNSLGFTITVGAGANGIQAMLPSQSGSRTLSSITRSGTNVSFTTQTIKGISYAVFTATAGTYSATYQ
jgi:hypothetical protein